MFYVAVLDVLNYISNASIITTMYTPTKQEINDFVTRGVTHVIPKEEFEDKLARGERMRIYLGVDPTRPDIHLGHAVVLRKMAKLQEWGHEIIFLIGDFTAQIGDPTGKDVMRQPLTHDEILKNAKTYTDQVGAVVRFEGENAAQTLYNSDWLSQLSFQDVVELSAQFTVQQMLERDMFQERIKAERPIGLHEFLYPLMQGYDSVAMDVDVEMGGSDQLFNIMAGRTLLTALKKKSKVVYTCELLEGTDGRKMSKSYENVINVIDEPGDMYGKIMSLRDELIGRYFLLCTDKSLDEIKDMERSMRDGANPRDAKDQLAREIVTIYHDEKAATAAAEGFAQVFQKGDLPDEIAEVSVATGSVSIVDTLVEAKLVSSKSEARRMVEQGGVRVNQEKVEGWKDVIDLKSGDVVQVGKRKFAKVK